MCNNKIVFVCVSVGGGVLNSGQDSGETSGSLELKMGEVFGKARKKSVILGYKQTLISFDYLQIFLIAS